MKIKENFVLKTIGDSNVVVSVGKAVKEFSGLITLNETGVFLWKLLEKGATEDELLAKLLEEYDVDKDTAEKDIRSFVDSVRKSKLLVE